MRLGGLIAIAVSIAPFAMLAGAVAAVEKAAATKSTKTIKVVEKTTEVKTADGTTVKTISVGVEPDCTPTSIEPATPTITDIELVIDPKAKDNTAYFPTPADWKSCNEAIPNTRTHPGEQNGVVLYPATPGPHVNEDDSKKGLWPTYTVWVVVKGTNLLKGNGVWTLKYGRWMDSNKTVSNPAPPEEAALGREWATNTD